MKNSSSDTCLLILNGLEFSTERETADRCELFMLRKSQKFKCSIAQFARIDASNYSDVSNSLTRGYQTTLHHLNRLLGVEWDDNLGEMRGLCNEQIEDYFNGVNF